MTKGPSRFTSPRRKLARALFHIEALERSIAEYHSRAGWYDTSFEGNHLRVVIRGEPANIDVIVGDVVHNLRAALDLTAVEVVASNGDSTKNVYFPFCNSQSELEGMIKTRNFDRASLAAQNALRALRPYKGGNEPLRALHDLDIQDKHHRLIPSACGITTPPVSVVLDEHGAPKGFAEGKLALKADLSVAPVIVWSFPTDGPLANEPIVDGLRNLLKLVSEAIDSFEAITA